MVGPFSTLSPPMETQMTSTKTFYKVLNFLSRPFVYVGMALIALVAVLAEMFMAGRRSEKIDEAKKEGERELEKIDRLEHDGDAAGLRDDILSRTKRILK